MKPLSETYKELGIAFTFPIRIEDANGDWAYYEENNGCGRRWERDANGNVTYFERSDGFCCRYEYDADGNQTYYENSRGRKEGTPRSAKTCEGKVVKVEGIKYKLKAI